MIKLSIKVSSAVRIYERDADDIKIGEEASIEILSHWNVNSFVVLKFDRINITVDASDLKKAIDNAINK